MAEVLVGTCGFQRGRRAHYRALNVVEVQQTFYDPPATETLAKWRSEAPSRFEFTVKAWMLITHEYNKRLWRRLKRSVPGKSENYGHFKPTNEVLWAWKVTLEAASTLNANIIVLQTPASFKPVESSISNIERFVNHVENDVYEKGLTLVWEPRGKWWDNLSLLEDVSKRLGLSIAGDPLKNRPIYPGKSGIAYMRLHGMGPGEVNYKYKYKDEDLDRLKDEVYRLRYNPKIRKVYVLFNNIYAFEDAVRFMKIVHGN